MVQPAAERKERCETTCWTVVSGAGTPTRQSLSGGSFGCRASLEKEDGKGMASRQECCQRGCEQERVVRRRMERTLLKAGEPDSLSVDV